MGHPVPAVFPIHVWAYSERLLAISDNALGACEALGIGGTELNELWEQGNSVQRVKLGTPLHIFNISFADFYRLDNFWLWWFGNMNDETG